MLKEFVILLFFYCCWTSSSVYGEPRVIIVGAGVAGLTVASELEKAGITNITILEAENRIGGRVWTIPDQNGKEFIELGAQWISSAHVHQNDETVESRSFDSIDIIQSNSNVLSEQYVINMIRAFGTAVLPRNEIDGVMFRDSLESFEKLFKHQFSHIIDQYGEHDSIFQQFLVKNYNGSLRFAENLYYFTAHIDDWAAETGKSFSELSVDQVVLESSYKNKGIEQFYRRFLKKDNVTTEITNFDIVLNANVTNINYNGNEVTVTANNGQTYVGDVVVVTVSLGVLKAKHKTLFTPPLPTRKIHPIDTLKMAIVEKAILEFDQPWWKENSKSFVILWSDEHWNQLQNKLWLRSLFGFLFTEHQPRSLQAWFLGSEAARLKDVDDLTMQHELMNVLRTICFKAYPNITEPIKFRRTNWATNPNFLGAYSYSSKPFIATEEIVDALSAPLKNGNGVDTIFFAGEAQSSTNLHATIHGSHKSGELAALEILTTHGVDMMKIIDTM